MNKISFAKFDESAKALNYKLIFAYYAEYFSKNDFVNHSVVICYDDQPVGYCICFQIDRKLTFPADGIRIVLLTNNQEIIPKLYKAMIQKLEQIATQNSCTEIVIKDKLHKGDLSTMGYALLNADYNAKVTFEMTIHFAGFVENEYAQNIRKSYKSLINWGRNNLDIQFINKDNLNKQSFLEFKNFHAHISGRVTRSDETWDLQYKMLEQGFGELALGFYENKLVSGSLFVDMFDATIYFTGVYERELFEYGISHYLLYEGICRSHGRGKTSLFTLDQYHTDVQDSKLYNIQFFKKGFCSELVPTIFWQKTL